MMIDSQAGLKKEQLAFQKEQAVGPKMVTGNKERLEDAEAQARILLLNTQREAVEKNQKLMECRMQLITNRLVLKDKGLSETEIDELLPL
jgi:hypothetical protein